MIELAVLTALRRGELLGLRWSDVDLERSVVHVRQQVTQDVANLDPCASCDHGLVFARRTATRTTRPW